MLFTRLQAALYYGHGSNTLCGATAQYSKVGRGKRKETGKGVGFSLDAA